MSYTERAARYICIFAYCTALFLFLKYGVGTVLPFFIAFIAATLAEKAALKISKKTGINKRIYCAVIIVMFMLVLLTIITAIFGRLLYEAREFAEEYLSDGKRIEGLFNGASELSERITERLNISDAMRTRVKNTVDDAISSISDVLLSKVGTLIEKTATGILSGLPSWILFVTVTVISTFYIGCRDQSKSKLTSIIPPKHTERLKKLKNGVSGTVAKYVRAYTALLSITATVLFAGFTMMKIKYAFLTALLIAVLDMLPVIGLSTVMIPWAITELINGNAGKGFALIAIFAVAVIIREASEPKIIGKCIGSDALVTLFSMYAGLKLFGVGGVIILPMITSGVIAYYSEKHDTTDINKGTVA